jgi:uncharacterized Zn finger protein (UPF0148 family)
MSLRRLPAKCPHCSRTIYSRRGREVCEWCEQPLPDEYRYTEAEQAGIDAAMAQIENDRKEKMARAEEEEQKKRNMWAAAIPFFFTGL